MLSDLSQCKFSFTESGDIYKIRLLIDGGLESNLCALLNSIALSDIPSFLDDVILKNSRSSRFGGFLKGPVFEDRPNEKDLDIKANQVQIDTGGSTYSEAEIIDLNLFYELVLAYAHKCLELVTWFDLCEKGIVTQEWVKRIRNWIIQFESAPPFLA